MNTAIPSPSTSLRAGSVKAATQRAKSARPGFQLRYPKGTSTESLDSASLRSR
jgi:hypothetical protein